MAKMKSENLDQDEYAATCASNPPHSDPDSGFTLSERSCLSVEVVSKRVTPFRVTGGTGTSFGAMVELTIADCLRKGERIASFSVAITETDWDMIETAYSRDLMHHVTETD